MLAAEVAPHLGEQLRQRGQRQSGARAPVERSLAPVERIRMVRVDVELRVRRAHSPHERDRIESRRGRARRGDAAGDHVHVADGVQRGVRGIQQPLHVHLRRVRVEEDAQVRLVPDLPAVDPGVVLRRRARKGRDVGGRLRRPARSPSASRPARCSPDREDDRDSFGLQAVEERVVSAPVVRPLGRFHLIPAQRHPHHLDPQPVEQREA